MKRDIIIAATALLLGVNAVGVFGGILAMHLPTIIICGVGACAAVILITNKILEHYQ
jgi:uncharacterized membrane protein YccC